MGRKKKNYDIEDIEDIEDTSDLIDDYDINADINADSMIEEGDDMPSTPMGLAHQISRESETVKHFKELPREVKYSFLDTEEKREVKHHSRAYRTWKYIEKIIDLRVEEDKKVKENRTNMLDITTRDELEEYFKSCGRNYLINDLDDLDKEEIDMLLNHIKILKHNHFLDTVENKKSNLSSLYNQYLEDNDTPAYIDDMDNIGKVMDTSITSMGFKGNASAHSVMTINAVKNENIEKDIREKTKFSFFDAIRGKLG